MTLLARVLFVLGLLCFAWSLSLQPSWFATLGAVCAGAGIRA